MEIFMLLGRIKDPIGAKIPRRLLSRYEGRGHLASLPQVELREDLLSYWHAGQIPSLG